MTWHTGYGGMATTHKERDARREQHLRALHAMAREVGLDDDARRDVIERVTGRRSARDLSVSELSSVLDHLRGLGAGRGGRLRAGRASGSVKAARAMGMAKHNEARRRDAVREPPPPGDAMPAGEPWVAKARVLWLSLWHLGELADSSEAALRAFCRRQTGIDALAWVSPEQATQIIDALKDWCGRAGFKVPPTERDSGHAAKVTLCRAIWGRLADLGAVRIRSQDALDQWASSRMAQCKISIAMLDRTALDRAAAALGEWLRRSMGGQEITAPLSAWVRERREGISDV